MFRLLIAALAVSIALPAFAQGQNCGERQAVIDRLADGYGESRQSIGLAPQGRVVEVFANIESGTWTITITLPNGMMCLVASGQNFERIDAAPSPTGMKL